MLGTTACDQVFGLERGADHGPVPIGHWSFDETSGAVAADDTATPHAAALFGDPARGPGAIGGALLGDGIDDYVRIDGLDFRATATVTVSLWVRFDMTPPVVTLFESSDNFNVIETGFGLFFDSVGCTPGTLAGELVGDVGYTKHCYGSPALHEWQHLVTIYDKTGPGTEAIHLYVDGELQPNLPSTPVDEHTNTGTFGQHPFFVLSRVISGVHLPAAIDDLQIFDRALAGDEVLELHAQGG